MSNLKKFICDNRTDFDNETVPANVWENIEAGLTAAPKKKFTLRPLYKWSMAAAAVLIIGTAFYFGLNPDKDVQPERADSIITGLSPEHASEVYQFVVMIDKKQEELKKLTKEQPELYREFSTAIDQLDSSYNTLKNQLAGTPNKEMLLEAMIQNLELQLSVLNQQLSIIKQIKESKKVSHEMSPEKI